jgi:glycosyltransferase involved in cell wall biosynthesis
MAAVGGIGRVHGSLATGRHRAPPRPVILLLHNRYRTLGGEERVVEDLAELLPQALGEDVEVLERGSAALSRSAAARGLLRGGLDPEEVGAAVRRTGARVVHAHNVQPAFGWRALQAARDAGARTVLTLHQYRLVCAVGTCLDPSGHDCTRCHGRDTRPGVRLNCRGGRADAVVYAAALARWSGRLVESADALTTPSAFTLARLQELGAPLRGRPVHVIANPVAPVPPELRARPATGTYAICSARLAPDKGVDVAIRACAAEGFPLVVTGHGPDEGELRSLAASLGADVRFAGRVPDAELARLRAGAALAIVPSRFAETFGLSAAEAMAAGLPVAASRVGALTDLLPQADLTRMGDAAALAAAARRLWGDAAVGERNAHFIAGHAAPDAVAQALARVYDGPA